MVNSKEVLFMTILLIEIRIRKGYIFLLNYSNDDNHLFLQKNSNMKYYLDTSNQ